MENKYKRALEEAIETEHAVLKNFENIFGRDAPETVAQRGRWGAVRRALDSAEKVY